MKVEVKVNEKVNEEVNEKAMTLLAEQHGLRLYEILEDSLQGCSYKNRSGS